MIDLEAIKAKWLNICGACDVGVGECSHPVEDYRPVMLELVRELEKLHLGVCVCVWAPDNEEGESGYVPEPLPYCPQHGEAAESRDARWDTVYDRLACAIGVDPNEPFPEVDVFEEVLRRLTAPDPEIGKTKSGFVHPLIHVNADGLCGWCELPLAECGGSCRPEVGA